MPIVFIHTVKEMNMQCDSNIRYCIYGLFPCFSNSSQSRCDNRVLKCDVTKNIILEYLNFGSVF